MRKIIQSVKSYLTLKLHYRCFRDVVSGNYVSMYIDCYGDLYMKDDRWSFFSVSKGGV